MTSRHRVVAPIGLLLAAAGAGGAVGCINTGEPTGYAYRYEIGAFGCGTSCTAPDTSAPIDSAALGDTVFVLHDVSLVGAVDSLTVLLARLRPACEQNVAVIAGGTIVRLLPTPSCPDSTYAQGFQLAGIDFPQAIVVYTRWVVDSQLAPGTYGLRGRVLAQPRVEPVYTIVVR